MWFCFWVFSLISCSVYFTYKKINLSWKGEHAEITQGTYKFKILRSKYKNEGVLIGITSVQGVDYTFKREKWFDKIGKSIGLVVEHQVGNSKFNDSVFVVADDASFHRQLTENPEISSTVLDIFAAVDDYVLFVKEIKHNSGCLWVKFGSQGKFGKDIIDSLAPKLIPLLEKLSEEIQLSSTPIKPSWKVRRTDMSAALTGISTALVVTGYIQIQRLTIIDRPFVIDDDLMFNHSFMVAGACLLLMVSLTVCLLWRSSKAHLVLFEVLLVAGFGLVLTSYAEMVDINQTFDETEVQIYEVKVLEKERTETKRNTYYSLYVDDWISSDASRRVRVHSNIYHKAPVGSELIVFQKSGALGYRWIPQIIISNIPAPTMSYERSCRDVQRYKYTRPLVSEYAQKSCNRGKEAAREYMEYQEPICKRAERLKKADPMLNKYLQEFCTRAENLDQEEMESLDSLLRQWG